jgi:DNA invertase Pin-like site-specific DNA recombinase
MRGRFIAYYRVSTDKQGKSGLGLAAQRKAVADYLNGGSWELIGEFTEVESGKRDDRPQLERAIAACKKHRARLIIAKLDRLSRNLAFIATLMERKVDFICCDNPHATKFNLHILAAVAEFERDAISKRTVEALAAAKARGKTLGN